jgi:hypothetical protein
MKYSKQKLYDHLSDYKKNVLCIEQCGTWSKNGKKYDHILPIENIESNLIDSPYKAALSEYLKKQETSLHHGFHHLNSSQALAFNLFFPMIIERKLNILIGNACIDQEPDKAIFEHIHDEIENTNFDFYIFTNKQHYFFEVKYSEDSFGTAPQDENHIRKYEEIYRKRIEDIADIDINTFFRNYQLWRNIIYTRQGLISFILPRFRSDLAHEIENTKKVVKYPDRVRTIYIDDICNKMIDLENESITQHYKEFCHKYLEICV